MTDNTRRNTRNRLAALIAAVGLMCSAATLTALADTAEIGPGVGMPLADGLSQEYTAAAQGPYTKVNGQYVDSEGNVIQGALTRGISVSKYQQDIDWNAVAADDVSFAFIRMGYVDDLDPYFDANVKGAAAAGLQVGTYLYSQALTVEDAVREAQFAVRTAKDYKISYPIAMDVESKVVTDAGLTRQQLTDIVNAFCKTVQDAGFHPIVFSYNDWLVNKMDTEQIPYDIWYARYGTVNSYPNRTVWQCTDSGTVKGIDGAVCLELAFTDYSQVIPADGWKLIDGSWYYFQNYQKVLGWAQAGDSWYYLDPADGGIMAADTSLTIEGTVYQFGADGAML